MIVIYTLPHCPACGAMEDLLEGRGVYTVVEVRNQSTADEILAIHPQMRCDTCAYGAGLPFAAEDGVLIGGYDDLVRHLHR